MHSQFLEGLFPHLASSGYRITSSQTRRYNCIAWAAGHVDRWWWPVGRKYWPAGHKRENTIEAFLQVFGDMGYEPLSSMDSSLALGYQKVALYVDDYSSPTHMARQLETGSWTSKLGALEDITHHDLEALQASDYGHVHCILIRKSANLENSE